MPGRTVWNSRAESVTRRPERVLSLAESA